MAEWRGVDEMKRRMRQYGADVKKANYQLALSFSAEIEAYAKDNASWQDRTANARQSLFTHVDQATGKTTIYLSHGMDYGVYLELRHQGRYAIILPTLEHFYPRIEAAYKRMLS